MLFSVSSGTSSVVPLATSLVSRGFNLFAPPNTALPIQTAKLPCKLVLENLNDTQFSGLGNHFDLVVVSLPHIGNQRDLCDEMLRDGHYNILANAVRDPSIVAVCRQSDYAAVIHDLDTQGSISKLTRSMLNYWACYVLSDLLHCIARRSRIQQEGSPQATVPA